MPTKIDATERLLNLVIALLGTNRGYSKSYIRSHVNGYAGEGATAAQESKVGVAFERMFERDKNQLAALGIRVSATNSYDNELEEQYLYRIDPKDYQVPQLRLDEPAMNLLAIAANLWSEATFGAAAQSALRKIATRTGTSWYEDETTVSSRVRTAEPAFEPLWDALRQQKLVSFDYRRSGAEEGTTRTVQPWGLGNKYGQWYLAGFDVDKGQERNYRLSRFTSEVKVHTGQSFDRPTAFFISTVLERLGTGDPYSAQVAVPDGAAHSLRSRLGTVVLDTPARPGWQVLRVEYREPELMADDVAALGAQAHVVAPAGLREAVAGKLRRAADAAAKGLVAGASAAAPIHWDKPLKLGKAKRRDTPDRLLRLLSLVPYLVANPGVSVAEVVAEFAITEKQFQRDLDTLNVSGKPGYFHGDLMDATTEAGQVFIRDAETLASPLRLSHEEACSVLVGLHALTAVPGRGEAALAQATEALRNVAGEDAWLADAVGLELVLGPEMGHLAALQQAINDSRSCAIRYLVGSRDELSERIIEPLRLFSMDSAWYVRAWCQQAQDLRSFRVDRIEILKDAGEQKHGLGDHTGWQPGAGIYDPGTHDLQVLLVADPATAQRLAPAYNARMFDGGPDQVGLAISVGDTALIGPLMARLGGHARVAGPEALRIATATWLAEAASHYDAVGETVPETHRGDG
ncbi:helix-turn-helix transcriptional regulator [Arthrobacter psychrochitiniphilus]|uniref:helix-turn-helix transcriptional regulator n=1 Tax=Arthrobacter psychrochitiniphilus TaxID=291045 RepID=UPI003F7CAFF5